MCVITCLVHVLCCFCEKRQRTYKNNNKKGIHLVQNFFWSLLFMWGYFNVPIVWALKTLWALWKGQWVIGTGQRGGDVDDVCYSVVCHWVVLAVWGQSDFRWWARISALEFCCHDLTLVLHHPVLLVSILSLAPSLSLSVPSLCFSLKAVCWGGASEPQWVQEEAPGSSAEAVQQVEQRG